MKRYITLISLTIFFSFCALSQNFVAPVGKSHSEKNREAQDSKVNVSNSTTIERALILSDVFSNEIVKLNTDLGEYTDLLIVQNHLLYKSYSSSSSTKSYFDKSSCKHIQNILELAHLCSFNIQNPFVIDKWRAKKTPSFLKDLKNPNHLYLYITQSTGRGDDTNTLVILKDYQNQTLYKATHINVSLVNALLFLSDD